MSESTKSMTDLQDGFKETQFQLREMKDYVDHFADNLVLNSQQITVDTYAGFSSKPITLTEVLKMCNTNFEDVTTVNNTQNEQITKIFNDLETKAPDSVLFNITTLEKKVGTIELHIQKEEEQGMGVSSNHFIILLNCHLISLLDRRYENNVKNCQYICKQCQQN